MKEHLVGASSLLRFLIDKLAKHKQNRKDIYGRGSEHLNKSVRAMRLNFS